MGYARIPIIIQKQHDEFFKLLDPDHPDRDFRVAFWVGCLLENLSAYVLRRFILNFRKNIKRLTL
ncbi:hypothetical protein [Candidatus Coxiella mudrowiae]|uniref:hypothetical protein n=1 Tax=Candidatus Coxiella mudrowiae TaxID=2054173 RepID=UPI001F2210FD|nr:hypothetical protein [Candidatus Coxiella mudrowiae]